MCSRKIVVFEGAAVGRKGESVKKRKNEREGGE